MFRKSFIVFLAFWSSIIFIATSGHTKEYDTKSNDTKEHNAKSDVSKEHNTKSNDTKEHNTKSKDAKFDESKRNAQFSKNVTNSTQDEVIVTLLNNAKNLIEDAKRYANVKTSCSSSKSYCRKPMDCSDIYEQDQTAKSGIYKIWPRNRLLSNSINVYCDMDDDGGLWTVIQRRGDFDSGKEYFYKKWKAYETGFGDLQKDFWLGNDHIYALTNQVANIVKFTLTDFEGNKTYATYDQFWIEDETHKYTMHVSGYRGTAGDSFSDTNDEPFSTKDQDNDSYDGNCAMEYTGAWWYVNCHSSNLNGNYLKGPHETTSDGVNWSTFRGFSYSLKDTVIKIRPKDFKKV